MEYKCFYESAMGRIVLTSDGENLTGLWFTTSRFSKANSSRTRESENVSPSGWLCGWS